MESICKSCEYLRICGGKIIGSGTTVMTGCSRYKERKPMTNADRIRAMTDEELAEMFLDHDEQMYRHCPSDALAECCQVELDIEWADCKDCWLGWLKQEANNENQT